MQSRSWELFVTVRREILSIISGIENADSYTRWDNTTPNSTTRRKLEQFLNTAKKSAAEFGVYIVTRHIDCGSPEHDVSSDEHGYVWADPYGLGVKWQDTRFIWKGEQLFQGKREGACPCSERYDLNGHPVIDDVVYSHDANFQVASTLVAVMSDIQEAIDQAGDKKPRSGIREHLLRSVLILNDAIMPITVEEHITASRGHG